MVPCFKASKDDNWSPGTFFFFFTAGKHQSETFFRLYAVEHFLSCLALPRVQKDGSETPAGSGQGIIMSLPPRS